MNILCTPNWDTEGQTLEECLLPKQILISNIDKFDEEVIGDFLMERFGFIHHGFTYVEIEYPVIEWEDLTLLPS